MKTYLIGECLDKVGGVERVMNALANGLNNINEDIIVISETKNSDNCFYRYNDSININYLVKYYPLLSNKFSNKYLFLFFRAFEYINKKIKLKFKIRKIVKSISDNDVIIFDRVYVALDWLPILYKYKKHPKIITRDAIHLYYFSNQVKNKMKKYFPLLVNTFVVSSQESIDEYNNFWGNSNINMVKIYNPLGIVPNKGFDYNSKTIVSIGRMDDKQKGYDSIINSMVYVHDKKPDWKLVIYGDGKLKKYYQELICKLNASDYITIKPSSKNVVDVFNNSAIYVMGSRYEGYANVLVEALSCGIPSISYDWLCGVDEIIEDNINGEVVHLKDRFKYFNGNDFDEDAINLANAIIGLIDSPDKMQSYSNNSIDIINSRNVELIVNKWIEIINKE